MKMRTKWHVEIGTRRKNPTNSRPAVWHQLQMDVYCTGWRMATNRAIQEWERHTDHGKGYRGEEIVVRLYKMGRVDLDKLQNKGEVR